MSKFSHRDVNGAILTEYSIALLILILLSLPLINMATCLYRYEILVSAVHYCADVGSTAQTFQINTPTPGAMALVLAAAHSYLDGASGIEHPGGGGHIQDTDVLTRINTATISPTGSSSNPNESSNLNSRSSSGSSSPGNHTVSPGAWNTKLAAPAVSGNIYSIQVAITAQCDPLIPFTNGFIPPIAGFTAPQTYTVSSQELVENVSGLNQ